MPSTDRSLPKTTAIPPRFRTERERVLRILARWEESTRSRLVFGSVAAATRVTAP